MSPQVKGMLYCGPLTTGIHPHVTLIDYDTQREVQPMARLHISEDVHRSLKGISRFGWKVKWHLFAFENCAVLGEILCC